MKNCHYQNLYSQHLKEFKSNLDCLIINQY